MYVVNKCLLKFGLNNNNILIILLYIKYRSLVIILIHLNIRTNIDKCVCII